MTVYRKELNYRNIGPVAQTRHFSKVKNTSGSPICEIIVSLKTAGEPAAILHSLEHSYKGFLNPLYSVLRIQPLLKTQEKSKCLYISWHGKYASFSSELH